MSNKVDQQLLDTYYADNTLGFKCIVEKFQEQVYWQIRRMTMNHQDTEDVMQNVFIKVWKGLPNFKNNAALYTWIYRIAFNETATFLTKNNKMPKTTLDESLVQNGLTVEGKEWTGEEISEILQNAIMTLPEKQAQVFQLKYFDELKFSEISELLGTSVGGLKASYHLAVKKIEAIIKEY